MPNRLLTYLGVTLSTLVVSYLVLVIGTVYLASAQTDLLSRVSDKEASIGQLEARYYKAIAELSAVNPASIGFVTPSNKLYARAAATPVLTRADY